MVCKEECLGKGRVRGLVRRTLAKFSEEPMLIGRVLEDLSSGAENVWSKSCRVPWSVMRWIVSSVYSRVVRQRGV